MLSLSKVTKLPNVENTSVWSRNMRSRRCCNLESISGRVFPSGSSHFQSNTPQTSPTHSPNSDGNPPPLLLLASLLCGRTETCSFSMTSPGRIERWQTGQYLCSFSQVRRQEAWKMWPHGVALAPSSEIPPQILHSTFSNIFLVKNSSFYFITWVHNYNYI